MISCDTNILMYYLNTDCKEHQAARKFIEAQWYNEKFALSEFVLVELYILLRNPIILSEPLSQVAALDLIDQFRKNLKWRIVDSTSQTMKKVWAYLKSNDTGRREIFDARLAFSLLDHGVKEFATHNTKHFQHFGFDSVFDPIRDR